MPALRDLSAALAAVVVARSDYYVAAEAHAVAATAARPRIYDHDAGQTTLFRMRTTLGS